MFSTGCRSAIREGETVALVGGIGSGKSTVFNLLLRFLDPKQGRILLDGHDIAGVTIASLRDQVSKLAQFPFFVKDTIRENIRLARPDASDADVEEACEQAHVHSVITTRRRCTTATRRWWTYRCRRVGRSDCIAVAR